MQIVQLAKTRLPNGLQKPLRLDQTYLMAHALNNVLKLVIFSGTYYKLVQTDIIGKINADAFYQSKK